MNTSKTIIKNIPDTWFGVSLFGYIYFLFLILKVFKAAVTRLGSSVFASVADVIVMLAPFGIIFVQELGLGVRLLIFPKLRVRGELTTDLLEPHGL